MKFETREDYEKYFSRLEAFPTQVHVQGISCSNMQIVVWLNLCFDLMCTLKRVFRYMIV